jgi:glycosyltransferase involved in cell wall biosynthesis
MKILHICSDFAKQDIYNQLVSNIEKNTLCDQYIFVPCRTFNELNVNKNNILTNVNYHYVNILNIFDRIFYHRKIRKTTKSAMLFKSNIDIIHAHFLFSDGGVALEYFYKFNIPYIVAVRNTDINVFFKYLLHLRPKGIEILSNASKIIFLSNPYKRHLIDTYIPKNLKSFIESKSLVIPNGIDKYWLENTRNEGKNLQSRINVLYIGSFTKNKNLETTISALRKMRNNGLPIYYTILGGGGDNQRRIVKLINLNSSWINYISRTNEKDKLKHTYQQSDIFCMPSKYETFGLVYIEAMTQGLPVIFTKNQGIDGYFKNEEIGAAVDSNNLNDIINSIHYIINNYNFISNNCIKYSKIFSWETISNQYIDIYKNLIR